MTNEVEISVTVTVKDGIRHALVEWLPGDAEAVELAIGIACSHAARGYEFQGVRSDERGAKQLWLAAANRPTGSVI